MGIEERSSLTSDHGLAGRLAYMCYLYMYRSVFEASQGGLLKRYFELSIKDNLSDIDSEELDFILELCCYSQKLSALICIVDQHLNDLMMPLDDDQSAEIEQARGRALEKILGSLTQYPTQDLQKTLLHQLSHSFNGPEPAAVPVSCGDETIPLAPKALSDRLSATPWVKYWAGLVRLKPLRLSKQCLLYVSFSLLGAFFATHRSNIFDIARMLFNIVDSPAMQMSLTDETSVKSDLSHAFPLAPVPLKCQSEFVRWTNKAYDGQMTSYEKTFRNSESTAAHEFLPPGSKIHLSSEATSAPVVVEVNEQSENLRVSYSAALQLDVVDEGVAPVTVEHVEVSADEIDKLDENQRTQLAQFQNSCGVLVSYLDDF